MANALDGQTRGAEYTLFPQPDSPAGRLFGHLVALQVPGTPIEIALSGLAGAVRLDPDVAAGALSRLATDGLISLDQEPESEHMSVTVMVAPPLDEYGIQPHWWETPDATPLPEVGPASGSLSNTGDARSRDKSGSRGNSGNSVSKANTGSSAPAGAGRERETMSERPEATAGAMT
ncbi:MAG: hypothetical protein M3442_00520, partial [Chloroflexota bacterium]|nr:hypothetical protein [Chloroflexota bacterium]